MKQSCSCRSKIIVNRVVTSIILVEIGYQEIFIRAGSASKDSAGRQLRAEIGSLLQSLSVKCCLSERPLCRNGSGFVCLFFEPN